MSPKRAVFDLKAATVLRPSSTLLGELVRAERLDPEEIAALQQRRAIDHARFAMSSTAFYRDRYSAAGFTLDDLRDPAAFSQLPIVEKSDVRENASLFHTPEAGPRTSRVSGTGGSTSEPLKLLHDRRFPGRVLEWRALRWWGVHPSENAAVVYRRFWTRRSRVSHALAWWPTRHIQLDTARLGPETIDGFIRSWHRVRPAVMIGYVGGIVELSRALEARGVLLPAPKAVAVTAAPLTHAQRAEIESAFSAPVYDHYRCGEIPWMAAECQERNGLHTYADVKKIEIVRADGRLAESGESGETVVTDLTNRVFPLVRYRLGDRSATLDGTCPCGMTLPRIASIGGRVTESARLPDGRVIAGDFLTEIFVPEPDAVRQFQVHQQADYSIVLRCIPSGAPDAQQGIERVVASLRSIAGDAVPVRLEIVDDIPHEGGKIRYIRSDVPLPGA